VTSVTDPYGRILDFLDRTTEQLFGHFTPRIEVNYEKLKDGGKVVSPTHWPSSIPQKHYFSASGIHLLSRHRVSNPRPQI
jgi:hypothetical protein